jgi:hypothetical protein
MVDLVADMNRVGFGVLFPVALRVGLESVPLGERDLGQHLSAPSQILSRASGYDGSKGTGATRRGACIMRSVHRWICL